MQITEKNVEGAKRELEIVLNAALVEEKLQEHLSGLISKASIPGFRPGKAPMDVIRNKHGRSGLYTVIKPIMTELCNQVLAERKENQLTKVLYDLPENWEESVLGGQNISVILTYEVFPEIEFKPFSEFKVYRPVYETTDEVVESSIVQLAGYGGLYEKRPDGEPAESGDRMTVSIDVKEGGKKIDELSVEDTPVILGETVDLKEVDEALVGTKVGEYRSIVVTLPEDFWQTDHAGKRVEFEIHVLDLEKKKDIEINEELAQNLGCKSVSELKTLVREHLEESFKNQSNQMAKESLTEQLLNYHEFPVAEELINAELNIAWEDYKHRIKHTESPEPIETLPEEEFRQTYREYYIRKVKLTLILYAYGDKYGIKVTEDELKNAIRAGITAQADQAAMKKYLSKPENVSEYQRLVNSQLKMQKVLDYILEHVEITDEKGDSKSEKIRERDVAPEEKSLNQVK